MSWSWFIIFSLVTLAVVKYRASSRKGTPLPPGPPGDPLIGHIRSMPAQDQEVYFYKLGLKYGDVVHLRALGQNLVILNSVQAAVDLLDKRGAIYSDRPSFPLYELLGMAHTVVLERYGPEWRAQRALVQQYFNKEKSKAYRPIQNREARILVQNLLSTTEDKLGLFLRFSTAVIIDINYGHQIKSAEDPYLKIANDIGYVAAQCGPPGATPIDLFPFLRHFPSWFPGTFYATVARRLSPTFNQLFQYPYDQMKERMTKGAVGPSFLASMIEDLNSTGDEDETKVKRIQAASGIVYLAGADTTASTLGFFLLAMVLYPEFQRKGQEEIDAVVGPGRLPDPQDRENLPFVEAILQEAMRWQPPIPAGLPHRLMEDDVYNGMFIPKGSIVIPNTRAMTLDAAVYKDPFKFDPTRYLPSPVGRGEPHPTGQFGFGRRICPGRFLGEDSAWIAIATILATTTVLRSIGEDGKEIVPENTPVMTGLASHPSPFVCDIKPRSEAAFKLLVDGV